MKRTVCTYAVGKEKFRVMALAMLQSVREHASSAVDRYVIFTDTLAWRGVPDWIELIQLSCTVSSDPISNWAIKPSLLSHSAVAEDILLYLDADTTVYSDVLDRCFKWIEKKSILVYMDFIPAEQLWGRIHLLSIYEKAGYESRNLKINSGIIGRAPDALGRAMTNLYGSLLNEGRLRQFFEDDMYRKNDEPYLGLAAQFAFDELKLPRADRLHDLTVHDYAITIGADPRMFSKVPGPIVSVPWSSENIVSPAIIHWVSSTQYLFYRKTLWNSVRRSGLMTEWLPVLLADEVSVLWKRLRLKLRRIQRFFRSFYSRVYGFHS